MEISYGAESTQCRCSYQTNYISSRVKILFCFQIKT